MDSTIVLHHDSDLSFLIGEAECQQRVLVASQVPTLASPVFAKILTDIWEESDADEIPRPADDPEAMLLMLRIVHLKFNDLPTERAFNALHKFALLCHKYDTVSSVRPFSYGFSEHEYRIQEAGRGVAGHRANLRPQGPLLHHCHSDRESMSSNRTAI
jgi:hypothetical protein